MRAGPRPKNRLRIQVLEYFPSQIFLKCVGPPIPIGASYALVTHAGYTAVRESLALELATGLFHVRGPFSHSLEHSRIPASAIIIRRGDDFRAPQVVLI
jgi:hypothetical protein